MCVWFSVLKTSFKICYLSVCSIALCMVRTGKFCSRRREAKAWHRLMEFTKMITWQKDTAGRVCFGIVGHTIATKCIVDISIMPIYIYTTWLNSSRSNKSQILRDFSFSSIWMQYCCSPWSVNFDSSSMIISTGCNQSTKIFVSFQRVTGS